MNQNTQAVDITCIILTYNEELHIARCIKNVQQIARAIFVIDSFSTDNTVEIASLLGAHVVQHKYVNQAQQFQWAIDNLKIDSEWVMRMDADEYLTSALITEIRDKIPALSISICGCYIPRDVIFLGKNIKHGRITPPRILRLWRRGCVYMEQRWMDERLLLIKGDSISLKNRFVDNNLNDITWWTSKHNYYANREIAVQFANRFNLLSEIKSNDLIYRDSQKGLYYKMPLFLRAFIYFSLRYFLLGGWLDGRPGLIWAILQAYWYRFLIDAKIYEIESHLGKNPSRETVIEYFKEKFSINLMSN